MSELEQLKQRIVETAYEGMETAIIRDDYEPAGQLMISTLTESGEFISQRDKGNFGFNDGPWKVWSVEFAPRF